MEAWTLHLFALTLCILAARSVSNAASHLCWPDESFALLKTTAGCPNTVTSECGGGNRFASGYYSYDTEDVENMNNFSRDGHFALDHSPVTHDFVTFVFCTHSVLSPGENTTGSIVENTWPSGCYCIFRKDGSCPMHFTPGRARWFTEIEPLSSKSNTMKGDVPDGIFNTSFIQLEFCCRCDGYTGTAIVLPKQHDFYLMPNSVAKNTCQVVKDMDVRLEYIQLHTDNSRDANNVSGSVPSGVSNSSTPSIVFCYYSPVPSGVVLNPETAMDSARILAFVIISFLMLVAALALALCVISSVLVCRYRATSRRKQMQLEHLTTYETIPNIARIQEDHEQEHVTRMSRLSISTKQWVRANTQTSADMAAFAYEVPLFPATMDRLIYTSDFSPSAMPRDNMAVEEHDSYMNGDEQQPMYMNSFQVPFNPPPDESDIALHEFIGKMKLPISINATSISMKEELGRGNFGAVRRAEWTKHDGEIIDVAVKVMKDENTMKDTIAFLREAAIMGQFSHDNVVKLYGVVRRRGNSGSSDIIVMEFLPNGDLKSYVSTMLNNNVQEAVTEQLLQFSRDIAAGMYYLSSKKFIHRDLAARNILLDAGLVCKIADFGMTRDMDDSYYYKAAHGGMVPVRWTAPEALAYKKYSTASDVWSYGCVLYEIWSLGEKPFIDVNVHEIFCRLLMGHRQHPPPGCPKHIYRTVINCWHPIPDKRPNFKTIHEILLQPIEDVLAWEQDDLQVHQDACVLGAGAKIGKLLYPDLQQSYVKEEADQTYCI